MFISTPHVPVKLLQIATEWQEDQRLWAGLQSCVKAFNFLMAGVQCFVCLRPHNPDRAYRASGSGFVAGFFLLKLRYSFSIVVSSLFGMSHPSYDVKKSAGFLIGLAVQFLDLFFVFLYQNQLYLELDFGSKHSHD